MRFLPAQELKCPNCGELMEPPKKVQMLYENGQHLHVPELMEPPKKVQID